MIEKRKHIRRFSAMNVTCRTDNPTSSPVLCLLANISKGGVALETRSVFKVRSQIIVSFITPDHTEIPIHMDIVHASPGMYGTLYGAKYNENDTKKFDDLNKYLLKNFNLY